MPKKTFQDVVPPSRPERSIRNVELPSRRQKLPDVSEIRPSAPQLQPSIVIKKPEEKKVKVEMPMDLRSDTGDTHDSAPTYNYTYDEPKKTSKKILYTAIGVFIIALAFGVSALFKSAQITVTPKQEVRAMTGTLTAQKDVTTGLGFQVVTISKDAQTQVPATGVQQVSTKAQGTIVIYNNTATVQKLIATTRFQTAAGLVFRLISPVTIPAKSTVAGKSVPGSAEALVAADQPGASYNISLSDFTLPAFKGDPKFQTIYARSKTAMSGGFAGNQKVVAPSDMTAADALLQSQLKDSLVTDITSQIPENFVLYAASVSFTFSPATQAAEASTSNQTGAIVSKKGTAQAVIFDKGALSQEIVSHVLPDASSTPIKVDNLEDLTFAYSTTSIPALLPATGQKISFTLQGNAHFVWTFDQNKLKADILGLSKSQARTVLSTYSAISSADIMTRPFWNQVIPRDPKKVTLITSGK